jgi:stage V sporulation protein AC
MQNAKEYKKLIKKHSPPSPVLKNSVKAFVFGGFICLIGQLLANLYSAFLNSRDAYTLSTVTLILLASLLTGLGIFDKIARHAGAGTFVPVTGFANSVVSPALDTKAEGMILGVGAKIFTIAGPVILYAVISGTVYGLIYYFTTLFL